MCPPHMSQIAVSRGLISITLYLFQESQNMIQESVYPNGYKSCPFFWYGSLAAFQARFSIAATPAHVLVMSTVLKACSEGLYLVIRNGFRYILLSSRGARESVFG